MQLSYYYNKSQSKKIDFAEEKKIAGIYSLILKQANREGFSWSLNYNKGLWLDEKVK